MIEYIKKLVIENNLEQTIKFFDNDLKKEIDKQLHKKLVHTAFVEACRYGYVEIVRYLLKEDNKGLIINNKNAEGFKVACACGRLNVVKYLLTDKSLKKNIDIAVDNHAGFRWACEYNQLEVVQYLLASKELTSHSDINVSENFGLIKSCELGHFELAKYLLTSAELKGKADLNAREDYAFRFACKNGHKEIINLLLDVSRNNHMKIDIYAKDCMVIKELIKSEKLDILRYLIMDCNLFELDKAKKYIKNPEVLSWFEKRLLYNNLNKNLLISEENNKKTKI